MSRSTVESRSRHSRSLPAQMSNWTSVGTGRHCCQIPPGLLGQFSQKNSAAGEKKLGRKPATPQITWKSGIKNFCYKFLGQFLPIIVKIRPQLGNLELGRFLGRWLPGPQEILLGHFWVQRPWIRPSGTSAGRLHCRDSRLSARVQRQKFKPNSWEYTGEDGKIPSEFYSF